MKKKVFKVGDRVALNLVEKWDRWDQKEMVPYYVSEHGEAPDYGTVTDVLSNGKVMVQWENQYLNNKYPGGQETKDLLLEEEMKVKVSELDKEYDQTVKEIKLKMKEAASLVKGASKLANKTGNTLEEMYDAVRPLVDAMDSAGWRSSSWGC